MNIEQYYLGLIMLPVCLSTLASPCWGEAGIKLNNSDYQSPIYLIIENTPYRALATGSDNCYVELFASPIGLNNYAPIVNESGKSIFQVGVNGNPGYFEGGIGLLPGFPDDVRVSLRAIAWIPSKGNPNEPGFALYREQQEWSQNAGHITAGEDPAPASLHIPSQPSFDIVVPEPSIINYSMFGAIAIACYRMVIRKKV